MPRPAEGLYTALRDALLPSGPGSGPAFRLDRFGPTLTTRDVVDVTGTYSPGLALERGSVLVNRVPADVDDRWVSMSALPFDDAYFFRLLSPAVPSPDPALDPATRALVAQDVSRLKADALSRFEHASLASLSGIATTYRPSPSTPVDWLGAVDQGTWTPVRLTVQIDPGGVDDEPLWRLRPRDSEMIGILRPDLAATGTSSSTDLVGQAIESRTTALERVLVLPEAGALAVRLHVGDGIALGPDPGGATTMYDDYVAQAALSELPRRLLADEMVAANLRAEPVGTPSTVTVDLEYVVVSVTRPWYSSPFVLDGNWAVPGRAPGALTAVGAVGAVPSVVVGFVAVREVVVTAAWSGADAARAAQAAAFGPFRVDPADGSGALRHTGVQVLGWVLEDLPALPPREAAEAPPPRRYTVRSGDTLTRVARRELGDGTRWPEIAAANRLHDPHRLTVGQILVIP